MSENNLDKIPKPSSEQIQNPIETTSETNLPKKRLSIFKLVRKSWQRIKCSSARSSKSNKSSPKHSKQILFNTNDFNANNSPHLKVAHDHEDDNDNEDENDEGNFRSNYSKDNEIVENTLDFQENKERGLKRV